MTHVRVLFYHSYYYTDLRLSTGIYIRLSAAARYRLSRCDPLLNHDLPHARDRLRFRHQVPSTISGCRKPVQVR